MKKYLVHGVYIAAILLVGFVTPTSADETVVEPVEQIAVGVAPATPEPVVSEPTPSSTINQSSFEELEQKSVVVKSDSNFRDRFFSVDRTNPYVNDPLSPEEEKLLSQSTHENDSWDSRVLGCNSLPTWEVYFECMWKPWKFGF